MLTIPRAQVLLLLLLVKNSVCCRPSAVRSVRAPQKRRKKLMRRKNNNEIKKKKQKTKLQLRVESSQASGKLVACFNASIKFFNYCCHGFLLFLLLSAARCAFCTTSQADASSQAELSSSSSRTRRVFLKAVTS